MKTLSTAHKNKLRRLEGLVEASGCRDFFTLSIEMYFKDQGIKNVDIEAGIVDGGGDCGIDAFYVFANGQQAFDIIDFEDDTDSEIKTLDLYLLQVKEKDNFELNPLKIISTFLTRFLDLSFEITEANQSLSEQISLYRNLYKKAVNPDRFSFNVTYVTKGIPNDAHNNIKEMTTCIDKQIRECGMYDKKYYPQISTLLFGIDDIIDSSNKKDDFDVELPFIASMSLENGDVFFVSLEGFLELLKDTHGEIKKHLFAMNIRDFLGSGIETNKEIMERLNSKSMDLDFWCYNNGITIVCDDITKKSNTAFLKNLQIVNGLQTSHTIFEYYKNGNDDHKNKNILIKVVNSSDKKAINDVIKSTNKQTAIPSETFRMQEAIHLSIEEELLRYSFYYERKPGFYRNKGFGRNCIVPPKELAQFYNALFLEKPHASRRSPASLFKKAKYIEIFREDVDVERYVDCVVYCKDIYALVSDLKSWKERRPDISNLIFHVYCLHLKLNKDIKSKPTPNSVECVVKIVLDFADSYREGNNYTILDVSKRPDFSKKLFEHIQNL